MKLNQQTSLQGHGLQWSILTQAFNHQSFSRPSRPLRVGSPETKIHIGVPQPRSALLIFFIFGGQGRSMIYLVSSFQHELGGGELGNDFWASSSRPKPGRGVGSRTGWPYRAVSVWDETSVGKSGEHIIYHPGFTLFRIFFGGGVMDHWRGDSELRFFRHDHYHRIIVYIIMIHVDL